MERRVSSGKHPPVRVGARLKQERDRCRMTNRSIDIVWAEPDWTAPHRTRIVDYATASSHGEPYAALIEPSCPQ